MKRRTHTNLQQLIRQNRTEIEKNPSELERIEKKIEEKHFKTITAKAKLV